MSDPHYITTIDIGSSYIAIAGKEDLDTSKGFFSPDIVISPSRGINRGYVQDSAQAIESLRLAIQRFEKKYKRTITSASIAIGGSDVGSQTIRTSIDLRRPDSEITSREIHEILEKAELLFGDKYPNKKVLHVFPNAYRVDDRDILGSPIGMFGSKLELRVVLVTVEEHHLDAFTKVINSSGIQVNEIIAGPLADSSICLNYQQKKQGCLLVNIGSETTQLSVYERGNLTSIKIFPIGSEDATNDVALGLQVPINEAQEIKEGKNSTFPQKHVREIIDARYSDIIEAIEKHLKSIKKSRLLPAGVIWTGAGSQYPQVSELGKSILRIPSVVNSIEVDIPEKKRKQKLSQKSSTAIGLLEIYTTDDQGGTKFSFKKIRAYFAYIIDQLRP